MKVLVVDDEPLARARLVAMLEQHDQVTDIAEASNGLEAIEQQQLQQSEVILLDIRMPGMDGLEAASHLVRLDEPPIIIFTTAYDDHALDAYDLNAIGYLLKPVQKERLYQSLRTASALNQNQVEGLPQNARQFISAQVAGNLQMVSIKEVFFFRAEQKYVVARHGDGELLLEDTLKQLESELAGRFIRIHRNALVALDKIAALEKSKEGHTVICLNGLDDQLEVSRRHLPEVRKTLKELSQT